MIVHGNINIIKGQTKSLFYCIVDSYGNVSWFDPDRLIKPILKNKGIIILALDSHEMKGSNAHSFFNRFKELNVAIELQTDNLWITIEGTSKYLGFENLFSDGNEFILATNPPQNVIPSLLNPLKGWQKDKLKEKTVQTLEVNLQTDDLYFCDDTGDIIFISKDQSLISLIEKMVTTFKKEHNKSLE